MKKLLLFFTLLSSTLLNAQPFQRQITSNKINGLSIGDVVPNVTLVNMRNYPVTTAKLSDFKGKLIILDFWNKWCSTCIASFPKMQKLQKEFGNKVQILLVTNNTEMELDRLFNNSPIIKNTTLPFVIGDSTLHKLFPHGPVPYHVWINADGRVQAMTDAINATEENIDGILSGRNTPLYVRKDALDFEYDKSFLEEGNGRQLNRLIYYSIIRDTSNQVITNSKVILGEGKKSIFVSPYYSLIMSRIEDTPKGGGLGLKESYGAVVKRILNLPVFTLYGLAFSPNEELKVIVEAKNSRAYYMPDNPQELANWESNNIYSYESVLPPSMKDKANEIMQLDLERFFGLKGIIASRKMPCIILFRTSNEDMIKSKGGDEVCEDTKNENGYIFRNVAFGALVAALKSPYYYKDGPIFIDETGYSGNVDLTIKSNLVDLKSLNNELKKYGLGLKQEDRLQKFLLLKEKY